VVEVGVSVNAEVIELFFTIAEKSNESDLSEQGRTFMNPDDPDAFVLPDLNTMLHDVDVGLHRLDHPIRIRSEQAWWASLRMN
jgi:preprotein translocase subunit SecA